MGLPDSARPGAVRPEDVGKPTQPPEPAGAVLEVPPVIDRPLSADDGPRVAVRQFRLVDARDIPEQDISVAEIEAILEEQRGQRPEGFTIGQLQEAASAVTTYYRQKGMILAQAVVPVQTVQDGIVEVQVYEGRLGRVLAEGNRMYKEVLLKIPFRGLIGKPITKAEIETALLQLTDFPGLTVFGVFQPGQQVGTADIVLRVQEEERLEAAMRVDNHGIEDTGQQRFRPSIEWNNLTGTADKLTITVQQTYSPKNNFYQEYAYERMFPYGLQAGGFFNRNDFDVGGEFAAQEIFGQTEQMGLWIDKDWFRSRRFNLNTTLELERKESKTLARGRQVNRDRLSVLSLEAVMDHVDTRFKGINFATIEYRKGFDDFLGAMGSAESALDHVPGARPGRQGGSGAFAEGNFDMLFVSAQRLQTVTPDISLQLRGEYQWSNDLLVAMEQYSVGGPDNVRAFPPAQQLFDQALFLSAEIIHRMPFFGDKPGPEIFGNRTWGELVQISAFYDHAIGRLNDPLSSEPSGHINFKGAGVQMRFTAPGFIESRLAFAWEVDSDDAQNERSPQIWADLTYRF